MKWLRSRKALAALLVAILIAVVAAWGVVHYLSLYRDLRAGEELLVRAADLLEGKSLDVSSEELEGLRGDVEEAEARLQRAAGGLRSDPLLAITKRVPWLGDRVEAVEGVVNIGVDGSQAAGLATAVLVELQRLRSDTNTTPLEQIVPYLESIRPYMEGLEDKVGQMQLRRRELEQGALPSQLRERFSRLDGWLAELEEAVAAYHQAQQFFPGFLGHDRPRTYLVLSQDNTEIFPSGGFINPYGLLTVDRGQVQQLFFEDVFTLFQRWQTQGGGYIEPPTALKNHLLRDWSWGIGEAGWSPNFPTSARQSQYLLLEEAGTAVDGVIALDFVALAELVRIAGPVTVEEYGVTVTADNAYLTVMDEALQDLSQGKDRSILIQPLSRQLLERLDAIPPQRWTELLDVVQRLLEEKHLLLYFNDRDLQAVLDERGWAGRLRQSGSDYLMVVDASVNSTKLNLVVEEGIRLEVKLDAFGNAHNAVMVRYANNLPQWAQGRDPELVHRMMGEGMYGDYLRLFTPQRSRLERVLEDGVEVGVEEIATEDGKTTFGRYFALPSGQRKEMAFYYVAPHVAETAEVPYRYHLTVQKQPGTQALPLTVQIQPPTGMAIISYQAPEGSRVSTGGEALTVEMDLRLDREVTVLYGPAES
ncbi:MAG: DUF4012 domain-containing protein [Dehalococcoidia bacterium]